MITEKVGIVGVGNMGSAILEGLLKEKLAETNQVWIFDKMKEKSSEFARNWKVHIAGSEKELVENVQIVLLAVKPQDLAKAGAEMKESFLSHHVLISILAGTPLAKIVKNVGSSARMVCAMPNLGAKVGEGVTALTGSDPHALSVAELFFSGCGKTVRLEESYFDLVTALSGSGPAYFFLVMELLEKMAVENGLSEEDARLLAVQTAVGAGELARSESVSPAEWRKRVTSKGGTTEAALKVLEKKKFSKIFIEALQAALKRGHELSG